MAPQLSLIYGQIYRSLNYRVWISVFTLNQTQGF
ncbi:hypothetical protein PM8797T_31960 [Gimesia maris DSM 8797]|nr:hypothetical protein PM8797T_31960 [Gimesia maris DSM 8797]